MDHVNQRDRVNLRSTVGVNPGLFFEASATNVVLENKDKIRDSEAKDDHIQNEIEDSKHMIVSGHGFNTGPPLRGFGFNFSKHSNDINLAAIVMALRNYGYIKQGADDISNVPEMDLNMCGVYDNWIDNIDNVVKKLDDFRPQLMLSYKIPLPSLTPNSWWMNRAIERLDDKDNTKTPHNELDSIIPSRYITNAQSKSIDKDGKKTRVYETALTEYLKTIPLVDTSAREMSDIEWNRMVEQEQPGILNSEVQWSLTLLNRKLLLGNIGDLDLEREYRYFNKDDLKGTDLKSKSINDDTDESVDIVKEILGSRVLKSYDFIFNNVGDCRQIDKTFADMSEPITGDQIKTFIQLLNGKSNEKIVPDWTWKSVNKFNQAEFTRKVEWEYSPNELRLDTTDRPKAPIIDDSYDSKVEKIFLKRITKGLMKAIEKDPSNEKCLFDKTLHRLFVALATIYSSLLTIAWRRHDILFIEPNGTSKKVAYIEPVDGISELGDVIIDEHVDFSSPPKTLPVAKSIDFSNWLIALLQSPLASIVLRLSQMMRRHSDYSVLLLDGIKKNTLASIVGFTQSLDVTSSLSKKILKHCISNLGDINTAFRFEPLNSDTLGIFGSDIFRWVPVPDYARIQPKSDITEELNNIHDIEDLYYGYKSREENVHHKLLNVEEPITI